MTKSTYRVLQGSAAQLVMGLPTVHCVVTSPPYFRKRKYGDSEDEIGREALGVYVENLCDVFDSVPLHPRGSVWVNLGDTRKDGTLLQVPEIFSLTMKSRGWELVDSVIWAKVQANDDGTTEGGCMIEPAKRRLNGNGYENLYRFVRKGRAKDAWSDMCAVSLPRQDTDAPIRYLPPELMHTETSIEGRRLHNVWRVQMGQTRRKHYAVYPPALVERPIAMTCPPFVLPDGTLSERIVEMREYDEGRGGCRVFGKYSDDEGSAEKAGRQDHGRSYVPRKPVTVGWTHGDQETEPGVVLDPFCGSGTTGEVALNMGRSFIGIDLYDEFVTMTSERCEEALKGMTVDPREIIRRSGV